MKDWKQKATTLGRKLQKLRKKYSEETKYRKSLEETIYSLQDQLDDQKQNFVSGINEIQAKYDELQLICRRSEETSESCKEGLKQTIAVLRNEQEMQMALIQKLKLDVVDKTDTINSLQFQIRELHIKCKSERCKQRMKNQGTQWNPQQYPLSSISTPKEVQSMESDIDSDDSEYEISSDIDVESAEFDQEIFSQSEHIYHMHAPRYECGVCHKRFGKKSTLKEHTAIHSDERAFKCSQCDSLFKRKGDLTEHIRSVHHKEKNFHCDYCSKGFFKKSGFIAHLRVHTGEKPFQCTMCGKAYTTKATLTRHKRIHTEDRPYECCKCHKAFRYIGHRNRHEKICKH